MKGNEQKQLIPSGPTFRGNELPGRDGRVGALDALHHKRAVWRHKMRQGTPLTLQ
jgi:hypothetical protein